MNPDFSDLLRIFNECRVKYLVIGGYAVIQYTEPRYTKDLDLWVSSDNENSQRVYDALVVFGAPVEHLRPESFTDEDAYFTIGLPPNRIDIWFAMKGVDAATAWDHREVAPFEGAEVNFIGRNELIANKEAVGRLQDLADAEKLRETANK